MKRATIRMSFAKRFMRISTKRCARLRGVKQVLSSLTRNNVVTRNSGDPNARGGGDHFTHLIRGFGFGCGFNTHWLMTNMRTALDRFLTDCLPVIVGSRRQVRFT